MSLEEELANASGFQRDALDPAQSDVMVVAVERDSGDLTVVTYNVVDGSFGTFGEIGPLVPRP